MKLSVVMPVFNEKEYILEILGRVQDIDIEKEIIVVDDFSTDGTREVLRDLEACRKKFYDLPGGGKLRRDNITFLFHDSNRGKGAALAAVFSRLRERGRLFVYVPAFQVLYSTMDRKVGHLRRYRRAGRGRLLWDAGFTVRRATYVDSIGFFMALLYRAVGDREGNISARSIRFFDSFIFPVSRALDRVFGRIMGKNLLVVAEKQTG